MFLFIIALVLLRLATLDDFGLLPSRIRLAVTISDVFCNEPSQSGWVLIAVRGGSRHGEKSGQFSAIPDKTNYDQVSDKTRKVIKTPVISIDRQYWMSQFLLSHNRLDRLNIHRKSIRHHEEHSNVPGQRWREWRSRKRRSALTGMQREGLPGETTLAANKKKKRKISIAWSDFLIFFPTSSHSEFNHVRIDLVSFPHVRTIITYL